MTVRADGVRLLAGAAVADITPPAGGSLAGYAARVSASTAVHDPLLATAVAVSDGATTSVVICADLIALDPDTTRRIARDVHERTGIPAERVAVAVTHTHAGPAVTRGGIGGVADPRYVEDACARIAGAGVAALAALEPAVLRRGCGTVHGVATNRRGGTLVDPAVPVVRLERENGEPIATVFSHACHPVTLGPDNLQLTADWPGYARRHLESGIGGVILFLQGCCGQLNTGHTALDSLRATEPQPGRTFEAAQRIGVQVGQAALEAATEPVLGPVSVAATPVELPLGDPLTPGELRALADEPGGIWTGWARAQLADTGPASVEVQVAVHRWGGVPLVFLPGEPFVEFAVELRAALGDPGLLVAGYTGGVPGYLPYPETHYAEGGYEICEAHRAYGPRAAFTPEAGRLVMAAARRLAAELGVEAE
ncbi:neutral/alkaline non-lysosomal ceramidase N-terminal domain-containing protein [Nonomuraea zeae]|uniref:Alkaline ceramidase n=1 Tax=Nonomuraea zeae TaxID=1642303 RepID=A0A5S4GTB1_9ACTN|nr:neutral/alkaline non-lysosomal ceramidase N-terminal domain-containing protein [Nonomuraea zeae]TMR36079.1 alkaline ceramidase [Nonomuraea zeae]